MAAEIQTRRKSFWRRLAVRAATPLTGVVLAGILTGCSLFVTPPPPAVVAEAGATLASGLRSTPGITEVTVTAEPRDYKDGGSLDDPGAWLLTVGASAETPAEAEAVPALAAALEQQLDTARSVVPAEAYLSLTGGGLADTRFEFGRGGSAPGDPGASGAGVVGGERAPTVADLVDAGLALRALPLVTDVSVSLSTRSAAVTVGSVDHWVDTVAELRALDGLGSGLLREVTVTTQRSERDPSTIESGVSVDPSTPDAATLAGLRSVAELPGVTSLSFDAVRPVESTDDWRPSLWVDVAAAPAAVVARLTTFDDLAPAIPGVPRATFRVTATSADYATSTSTEGFLGLPLGSTEPDDLVPAPTPPPPPSDPAADAARDEANRRLVTALLDAAGDTAGIHGTPSVFERECTSPTGYGTTATEIVGTVELPVYEIADSADDAYAAIVATWDAEGYTAEEHALGTEERTGGPLLLLTIRGTQTGISIWATAYC